MNHYLLIRRYWKLYDNLVIDSKMFKKQAELLASVYRGKYRGSNNVQVLCQDRTFCPLKAGVPCLSFHWR